MTAGNLFDLLGFDDSDDVSNLLSLHGQMLDEKLAAEAAARKIKEAEEAARKEEAAKRAVVEDTIPGRDVRGGSLGVHDNSRSGPRRDHGNANVYSRSYNGGQNEENMSMERGQGSNRSAPRQSYNDGQRSESDFRSGQCVVLEYRGGRLKSGQRLELDYRGAPVIVQMINGGQHKPRDGDNRSAPRQSNGGGGQRGDGDNRNASRQSNGGGQRIDGDYRSAPRQSYNGGQSGDNGNGEYRGGQGGDNGNVEYRGGQRGDSVNGQDNGSVRPQRRQYDRRNGPVSGNEKFRNGGARDANGRVAKEEVTKQKSNAKEEDKTSVPAKQNDTPVSEAKNDGNDGAANEVVEKERTEKKEKEEKEMTLVEYEKILEEKRKALVAEKAAERKVELDKELESMRQLSLKKGTDEIFIKLGSDKDAGKRKDDAKAKKAISISEFLKPSEGEKDYRLGRGCGGRGRSRGGFGGRGDRPQLGSDFGGTGDVTQQRDVGGRGNRAPSRGNFGSQGESGVSSTRSSSVDVPLQPGEFPPLKTETPVRPVAPLKTKISLKTAAPLKSEKK